MKHDFIQAGDYSAFINNNILNKITGGNEDKIFNAEEMAIGFVVSKLGERFDIQAELKTTGEKRNKTLLRWLLSMSVYHLYNTIPDTEIPERVTKNYNDARQEITSIAKGKDPTDLLQFSSSGVKKTRFRWGSAPRRSHSPF